MCQHLALSLAWSWEGVRNLCIRKSQFINIFMADFCVFLILVSKVFIGTWEVNRMDGNGCSLVERFQKPRNSICLSVCQSVCLSMHLPLCLSMHLPLCLYLPGGSPFSSKSIFSPVIPSKEVFMRYRSSRVPLTGRILSHKPPWGRGPQTW